MKGFFFFIILCSVGFFSTSAQIMGRVENDGNTDSYRTASGRLRTAQEAAVLRRVNDARRANARFGALKPASERNFGKGPTPRQKYEADMKKARKYIAPDRLLQTQYRSFLNSPKTGIIKLLADKACESAGKDPIRRCPQNFIAGKGRYFSFRLKEYVADKWADLEMLNDYFVSNGADSQGILVNLGDVDLDALSLTSEGVEFLTNLAPATRVDEINDQYMRLLREVEAKGFRKKPPFIEINKGK